MGRHVTVADATVIVNFNWQLEVKFEKLLYFAMACKSSLQLGSCSPASSEKKPITFLMIFDNQHGGSNIETLCAIILDADVRPK